MTVYQIAEVLGKWPDEVRDTLTPADLCEWSVYLNSPFSARSRETLTNGWLVHTVRSILADRKRPPKFTDSVFPFDKLAREFFAKPKGPSVKPNTPKNAQPLGKGGVEHLTQVLRKKHEQWLADYKAGRVPGKNGLFVNEQLKR